MCSAMGHAAIVKFETGHVIHIPPSYSNSVVSKCDAPFKNDGGIYMISSNLFIVPFSEVVRSENLGYWFCSLWPMMERLCHLMNCLFIFKCWCKILCSRLRDTPIALAISRTPSPVSHTLDDRNYFWLLAQWSQQGKNLDTIYKPLYPRQEYTP